MGCHIQPKRARAAETPRILGGDIILPPLHLLERFTSASPPSWPVVVIAPRFGNRVNLPLTGTVHRRILK
jgi:hypothetical protein